VRWAVAGAKLFAILKCHNGVSSVKEELIPEQDKLCGDALAQVLKRTRLAKTGLRERIGAKLVDLGSGSQMGVREDPLGGT